MTTVVPFPVAAPYDLDLHVREACLGWLARSWEDLGPEWEQLLTRWAHKSLSLSGRERLFELYQDAVERLDALESEPWTGLYDDLRCDTEAGQDVARELAGDAVREALYPLIHGENER